MEVLLDRCLQIRPVTVLVLGDVMCDSYLLGKITRISPEAPVPVFESTERYQTLGGAANVAANLRALGCEVRLLSVVGADAEGSRLRALLQQQGLADTWLLEDPTRSTTEKIRLLAQQQHVLRLDQENRTPLASPLKSQMLAHASTLMTEVDGVVCSDYHKGVCAPDVLAPLFTMACEAGLPIIVDPKQDFTYYRGATVLTPNLIEVERASRIALGDEGALQQAVEILLRQSQAQALLVTRGKDGLSLFSPPYSPVHIAARAREVFDVTGAGDTVIAAFSMAMLGGLSLEEAARLANTAAGIVVGKMGTSTVSLEELRTALGEEVHYTRNVLPHNELALALQFHRQQGEHIVFTNGCFDLLHVGHIHYLQQAAALGDRLVVGLNSDASVRLLKGEGRPMIGQEDRARLLVALACVDYVTIFNEPTPVALIKLIRPDILVKGGDYTPETVVGRDEVEAYGGKVHIVSYMPGVSTTEIIDSVSERALRS